MEDIEYQLRSRSDGFVTLAKSNLGDAGAGEVSLALELYPILHLNVERNNIGASGCKQLALVLSSSNATLQRLYLSGNKIGLDGVTALANMLRVNQSLEYLDLMGCSIGPDGAIQLALATKVNRTLKYLRLSNNSIGPLGHKELTEGGSGWYTPEGQFPHNYERTILSPVTDAALEEDKKLQSEMPRMVKELIETVKVLQERVVTLEGSLEQKIIRDLKQNEDARQKEHEALVHAVQSNAEQNVKIFELLSRLDSKLEEMKAAPPPPPPPAPAPV
eukprot:PhF_6_TR40236/c1_g2_i1/m.59827